MRTKKVFKKKIREISLFTNFQKGFGEIDIKCKKF